jgi:hypothetical protein
MTFAQLYQMALRRVGEHAYLDGALTAPTIASLDSAKAEVNAAYVDAVNILASHHYYAVVDTQNVTYASGTREKDLRATLTNVPRKILYVGYYASADTTNEANPVIFPWGGNHRFRFRHRSSNVSTNARPAMYLRGYYLGFCTTPTTSTIIEVRYAPVCETLSTDAGVPQQVPAEHHEYIAQLAAFNLAGAEAGDVQTLVMRLAYLREALESVGPNLNEFSPNVPGSWTARY